MTWHSCVLSLKITQFKIIHTVNYNKVRIRPCLPAVLRCMHSLPCSTEWNMKMKGTSVKLTQHGSTQTSTSWMDATVYYTKPILFTLTVHPMCTWLYVHEKKLTQWMVLYLLLAVPRCKSAFFFFFNGFSVPFRWRIRWRYNPQRCIRQRTGREVLWRGKMETKQTKLGHERHAM